MRRSRITLKENKGILALCSSKPKKGKQAHPTAPQGGMKHPSSLNNQASCQGIATVLLGRPGTSIPALFNRHDLKETSKNLQFHFHKVTASTQELAHPLLPLPAAGL